MYKRFHRLGFNGRFISVNWHGKTGLDYHHAVYNAFQTSKHLSASLNNAMKEPGSLTVAAHSLGNVVVSNAIANGGLNVERYFMINAAVPIEAYDSAQKEDVNGESMENKMTEVNWKGYPRELLASHWHELFEANSNDQRNRLTWKNQFEAVVPIAYNFYSPGDEVLENPRENEKFSGALWKNIFDWEFAQHTWVMQEMGKGCNNLASWVVFECSGGWKFNEIQSDLVFIGEEIPNSEPKRYRKYSSVIDAVAARGNNEITDEELVQYGFFRTFSHFKNNESEYSYLYDPITNPVSIQLESHQWDLLASGLPAMSFAVATNAIDLLPKLKNIDMEELRGGNKLWPPERIKNWDKRWLHSDIRDVALPYVYHTLDEILKIGEFRP